MALSAYNQSDFDEVIRDMRDEGYIIGDAALPALEDVFDHELFAADTDLAEAVERLRDYINEEFPYKGEEAAS